MQLTLTRIFVSLPHLYHDTAKPFDPEKAWTDHLNRLADIDRLYPSKTPLLSRHISPPLSTKRLFDIHGEYSTLPVTWFPRQLSGSLVPL